MGKSTTAQMFRDLGYPVWDADQTVHDLYAKGGKAVAPVADMFPTALVDREIDRGALKAAIHDDPDALTRLESVVHPLVAEDRQEFLARHSDAALVVLDIPLLFEGRMADSLDGIAVVSTEAETQRSRVLQRPGMTAETFELIRSRQIPDSEKRARADWIIPTDTLDGARDAVAAICQEIERNA